MYYRIRTKGKPPRLLVMQVVDKQWGGKVIEEYPIAAEDDMDDSSIPSFLGVGKMVKDILKIIEKYEDIRLRPRD